MWIFVDVLLTGDDMDSVGTFSYKWGQVNQKTSRSVKKRKLKDANQRFIDAENIEYFFILLKKTGVPVFGQSFSTKDIEPAFAGPFIVALVTFKDDLLGIESPEKDVWSIKSPNFHLHVTKRKSLSQVFFLREEPSERLEDMMIKFADYLELKYQHELANFDGDLSPFQTISEDAMGYFELHLVAPCRAVLLKSNLVKNLSKLELRLYHKALWKTKKKGFFNPLYLIEIKELEKNKKMTRERVAAAVYQLFTKNFFLPLSNQEYQWIREESAPQKMYRFRDKTAIISATLMIKKILAACIKMASQKVDYLSYINRIENALEIITRDLGDKDTSRDARTFFEEKIRKIKRILQEIQEFGYSEERCESIERLGLIICGYILIKS